MDGLALKMHENKLVSVIIPAYNHQDYVQKTLRSIIDQSHPCLELIVINDGSIDLTHSRILALKDECTKKLLNFIYISNENQGVAKTLNLGIRMATGEYVFLIASDDVAEPHTVSFLLRKIEASKDGCAVACGNSDFIDASGEKIYLDSRGNVSRVCGPNSFSSMVSFITRWRYEFDYRTASFGTYASLLGGNYLPGGLLIKRNAMIEAGLYDECCRLEDWDMWLKLSKHHTMLFVDEFLCHYRIHESNTSITQRTTVIKEGIRLLIREKPYCLANGLAKLWKMTFANSIVSSLQWLSTSDLRQYLQHIRMSDLLILGGLNLVQKRLKRMTGPRH